MSKEKNVNLYADTEKEKIENKIISNKRVRKSFDVIANKSCAGSKFERIYKYKSIEGKNVLVLDSTKNVYNLIQSYKDDNNIYKILDRVLNHDYSMLDKNQGDFNFDDFPTSINEMNDFNLEVERRFNASDPKLKAKFDNNFKNMLYQMQNGKFESLYNDYLNENHPEILKRREAQRNASVSFVKEVIKEVNEDAKKVDK